MSDCPVAWRDLHVDPAARADMPGELELVRERLHVVDEDGRVGMGFDAFPAIWNHSSGERWKARLLGMPGIRRLCRAGYNAFTRGLYGWNRRKDCW